MGKEHRLHGFVSDRLLSPARRLAARAVLRGRCRRACCKSGAPVGADAIHQHCRLWR